MCADDGAHPVRSLVIAVKEGFRRLNQGINASEQLAVGDLAPELTPEHLNGIEPRAVGGQIQQHETASRAPEYSLDLIILMCVGIIPCHIDRLVPVLVEQGLQQ